MQKPILLLLGLCMLTVCLAYPNTGFGQCGDTLVTGVKNFDYKKFVGNTWDIAFAPNNVFYQSVKSANLQFSLAVDGYICKLSILLKDGTTQISKFHETYLGNSSALETQLNDCDKPSQDTNTITIYGFKDKAYVQYFICSTNGVKSALDARFVIVPRGKILTSKERVEINKNDKKQKFFGDTVKLFIGQCKKNVKTTNDDE
uniref:Lipocalin/cytosolic fatty-acid binding domain-containing protein n=1 Tax=Clastoptera arizonana TaxID=38151 RepID=A0A1B6CER7_9HEMI